MIDKEKLQVGTKLKIWSTKFNSEQTITIIYKRLNVVFFLYENNEEDWLPTGSYIIESASFV